MNGSFQGMAMNNLAYSGMIGQGNMYGAAPYGSGAGADAAVGRTMNRAHGIGMPLAGAAIGLMGLDPMSLGIRAGMGAYGAGAGLGGAALAGAGVALPVMAAGAAIQYAGNQMYTGAQDQMSLNNTLRQSFAFRNNNGGMGFQRSEMSSIGSLMREMTHDFGPGGEIASFRELSTLAGKMGGMGFAQGVRDVQEFSKRFKEMVGALKTMARDLGTTLEGAMEFAQAAKGSGVFGMQGMQKFTSAVRGATVSGGLAMSEVTGAASIGSQISRSIGGLGRQGAMAGIRTIGQIGTAQQMGVLSEEDIYNATGLTGAEGRQALAMSSMQKTARFLQTGRGRRMIASMADKNGNLDETAVMQAMSGGMGISETMSNDASHLGRVGRANFIRNEGRLRGAVLEKFGGFGNAMQLSQWASSKGIDINDMDDRSMLFAQRQLGMGRDELDVAVKMVNNMPQILREMETSKKDDQYFQRLATSRKQRGLSGVKQRFEQSKEVINGSLQKVGQDIFNQASEDIETFFNKLFDTYVDTANRDIHDAYRSMRGGAGGHAGRAFGVGGTGMGSYANNAGRNIRFGGGGPGMLSQMSAGTNVNAHDALLGRGVTSGGVRGFLEGMTGVTGMRYAGQLGHFLTSGQSDMSKLKEAGWGKLFEGARSDADVSKAMSTMSSMRQAAAGAGVQTSFVGSGGSWLKEAYAMGAVQGKGLDRADNIGKLIEQRGTVQQKQEWNAVKNDPVAKAAFLAKAERSQGIGGEGALGNNLGVPDSLRAIERGTFASEGEANRAFATALGYQKQTSLGEKVTAGAIEGAIGAVAGMGAILTGGATAVAATGMQDRIHKYSQGVAGRLFGTEEKFQNIGKFIRSEEGRDLSIALLSSDKMTALKASQDLENQLASAPNDANAQVKRDMLMASRYHQEVLNNGGRELTPEQEAAFFAKHKDMDPARAKKALAGMNASVVKQQRDNLAKAATRAKEDARIEQDKLVSMGIYNAETGNLTRAKYDELSGISKSAADYGLLAMKQLNKEKSLVGDGGDRDAELFGDVGAIGKRMSGILSGMSVAERRKLAAATGDSGAMRSAAAEERFQRASRKGGAKGAINQMLGAGLSKEELGMMNLGSDEGARSILARAGIDAKEVSADMVESIKKAAKGGLGAGEAIRQVMETKAFGDAQKKKKLDQQESEDPLQAAIKKNGEQAIEQLKKIARFTAKTSEDIAALDKLDEKDGGPKK